MAENLRDVTGRRGEVILELQLTDFREFDEPLFRLGFLGDKWPSIDFYVELRAVGEKKFYFFAQAKTTTAKLARTLHISTKKKDIAALLQIPGPTYIFGIHAPSGRVFVRSVHAGTPLKAITRMPATHELTSGRLRMLHKEVREFWEGTNYKPTSSVFA
jgi:hypothetical protein